MTGKPWPAPETPTPKETMTPKAAIGMMALISALLLAIGYSLLINDQNGPGWFVLVGGTLAALLTLGQLGKAIK